MTIKKSLVVAMYLLFCYMVAWGFLGAPPFSSPRYYKCPNCGTNYKQKWYQGGLPGQLEYRCGSCNAELEEVPAEKSGWVEGREPNVFGH